MNLKTREFKATIESYIKSVGLPAEVKRMALKEIYDTVSAESDRTAMEELRERDSEERRKESE